MVEGLAAEESKDGVFLGRLAWVLHRLKDEDRAGTLADRAAGLPPEEPAARKELAGVLAALGRTKPALRLYEGLPLDLEDRQRLAVLYAADHDFAAAEQQCRAILEARPEDRKAARELADVLSWKKDYPESIALFEKLARQDPADPELARRLAEVLLWTGDYDQALARFQALLEANFEQPDLWHNFVDAAASARQIDGGQAGLAVRIAERTAAGDCKDVALLTRLAWVLHSHKEAERASGLLDRALALQPQDPAARKELAGVLAATGRTGPARQLYEGLPLDVEDRYRLASLYAADHDFAAAEEQCRTILKARPGDTRAMRQLADVLSWKKDYPEALALFERLVREAPQDRELQVRLAEVTLWSGARDQALARYRALLEAHFDQEELWRGYTDAAASAQELTPEHARLALRISERVLAGDCNDVVFLTRLAWVLQRLKETERAGALLDHALALRPQEPAQRRELAGVLAAAGRNKDAIRLCEGLPLDAEDRYRLAALYAADHDFTAAEQQCRALLADRPGDTRALRLHAAVLTWKKDYPAALELMQKLAEADAADPDLPLRLAELLLWSGDYGKALERYQVLLEANFEQPALWHGFVDAAASAGELSAGQSALAGRIAERVAAGDSMDVAFLARLGWLLYRAHEPVKAVALLDRALAQRPQEPGLRRELAGTLAVVGKFRDALHMYEGLTLDPEDRYHLVGIYATALLKSREILEEQPDDKDAQQQSEYVLGWKKTIAESVALLQKMAAEAPRDHQLRVRAAEVTLWSGAYDQALARFQALLEEQFDQRELWRATIDAAASAEGKFTPAEARLIERIYAEWLATENRVEYLSRLAWVLHRLKEAPKVERLLDRALAPHPADPAVRRELAGVLAAAGRYDQARRLYDGLKLTFADHYRLAEIAISSRRYDEAEREVGEILQARPEDFRGRMLQAAVLSGTKHYAEAAQLYHKLLEEHADDRTLPVKVAELTLWGGDYDGAVVLYQELLDRDMDQAELWRGYVDAAASATRLSDKVRPTALAIYGRTRAVKAEDTVFLARLAWVLRRVKELGKSAKLLEKALALEPDSRSIRQQLAETLQEKGDYDEAEKHFRILLHSRPSR
jgi:predicted Zn-dependent protease